MRGQIENTSGCNYCREAWFGYGELKKIGLEHSTGAVLYRCPRCETCWETDGYRTEIVQEEGDLQRFSEWRVGQI